MEVASMKRRVLDRRMDDRFFVARVSNLLYRGFPIRRRRKDSALAAWRAPAEWNSAIPQIGNPRYAWRRNRRPSHGPGK